MTTWNEALHPREGGKFAPKGSGGKSKGSAEGLSYNGRTGAGYGKKGGDNRVSALQKALNRLGLTDSRGNKLVVDGKLGPRTTAAIRKAQRALGLKVDGVATPGLLAKLRDTDVIGVRKPGGPAKKATPVKGTGGKAAPRRPGARKAPAKKVPPKAKKMVPPKKTPPRKAAPVTIHVR